MSPIATVWMSTDTDRFNPEKQIEIEPILGFDISWDTHSIEGTGMIFFYQDLDHKCPDKWISITANYSTIQLCINQVLNMNSAIKTSFYVRIGFYLEFGFVVA